MPLSLAAFTTRLLFWRRRQRSKCCSENPGANLGCCPHTLAGSPSTTPYASNGTLGSAPTPSESSGVKAGSTPTQSEQLVREG